MTVETLNRHNLPSDPTGLEYDRDHDEAAIGEITHQIGSATLTALEGPAGVGVINTYASHGSTSSAAPENDLQLTVPYSGSRPMPRTERLPYLESRRFDPENALLKLELFSGHNIFITPLSAFDTAESHIQHALPVEFGIFTGRRERIDGLLGAYESTAGHDYRLRQQGVDVDGRIFRGIDRFLKTNPRGINILEAMGIQDVGLGDMSPKETIYLIGYLMHELTNYQTSAMQYSQGSAPADMLSSIDILNNGLAASSKQGVKPLGVCRNFADVGEALFAAFKSQNPKLTNVYCHGAVGYGGATTGKLHRRNEDWKGHAWLDFVAVGKDGHMSITTVDPTWTRRNGRSLTMYDMTNLRIGTHTRSILAREKTNYVSRKERNLDRIRTYYEDQIDKIVQLMKRQHSGGGPLDLTSIPADDRALNSAMYYAIDYVVSASEFGGSTFHTDRDALPKHVLTLVRFSAKQPDIVFSPAEYSAVRTVLHRHMTKPGITDANRNQFETLDKDLQYRYALYSKEKTYKDLFTANEG